MRTIKITIKDLPSKTKNYQLGVELDFDPPICKEDEGKPGTPAEQLAGKMMKLIGKYIKENKVR